MPLKRSRTPVACQRCKSRKQRCDGNIPRCGNCVKSDIECIYPKEFYRGQHSETAKYIDKLISENESLKRQLKSQQGTQSASSTTTSGGDESYLGCSSGFGVLDVLNRQLSINIPLSEMNSPIKPLKLGDQLFPHYNLSDAQKAQILKFYFRKTHWKFPAIHRVTFNKIILKPEDWRNQWENFLFEMVLAIGSQLIQARGSSDIPIQNDQPEILFQRAKYYLSMAELSNFDNCLAYFLMAYFLRVSKIHDSCHTSWILLGMAMRCATEIGLHKNQPIGTDGDTILLEHQKRVFWCIYMLDRTISTSLGRPFAIPEHDVDIQFPVEVDDDSTDILLINQMRIDQSQQQHQNHYSELQISPNYGYQPFPTGGHPSDATNESRILPSTTSSMIHTCKLRRIESRIQLSLYSGVVSPAMRTSRITDILESELDNWLTAAPGYSQWEQSRVGTNEVQDYFLLEYFQAKRLLLHSQFNSCDPSQVSQSPIFVKYLETHASLIATMNRLRQRGELEATLPLLQSLFISGVNLIYCYSVDSTVNGLTVIEDIKNCHALLSSIVDRWPSRIKYRQHFEEIMDKTLASGTTSTTNTASGADASVGSGNSGGRVEVDPDMMRILTTTDWQTDISDWF